MTEGFFGETERISWTHMYPFVGVLCVRKPIFQLPDVAAAASAERRLHEVLFKLDLRQSCESPQAGMHLNNLLAMFELQHVEGGGTKRMGTTRRCCSRGFGDSPLLSSPST